MKVNIIYQDDYYIIVEKPANLFVHPYHAESNEKKCLMKYLRNQVGHYVYPVNRLDRPVSGLVVFATKSDYVRPFQEIWNTDEVQKKYIALARSHFKEAGEFNFPLKADNKIEKDALTLYTPLRLYQTATLLEVEIKTGRFHQIRRHFSRRVQHLLGDRKYGKKKYNDYYLEHFQLQRIFLHCHKFSFTHPLDNKKLEVLCPLPEDLQRVLELMEKELLETFSHPDYIDGHGQLSFSRNN